MNYYENNNNEESITGLLLLNGLAKLSKNYYNCPNGDSFKLAENSAKEKSLAFGVANKRKLSSCFNTINA